MAGSLQRVGADGRPYLEFRYGVIRLWHEPMKSFLEGGPGMMPLALLTNDARADLQSAVDRFEDRLKQTVSTDQANMLRSSAYVLLGLRYERPFIQQLFQKVTGMEESTTYQWIVQQGREQGRVEGELAGRRDTILVVGTHRFGSPDELTRAELQAVNEVPRLKRLLERIMHVSSWQELLLTE